MHSKGAFESARKLNWKTLQVGSFRCTCTVTGYTCIYVCIHPFNSITLHFICSMFNSSVQFILSNVQ